MHTHEMYHMKESDQKKMFIRVEYVNGKIFISEPSDIRYYWRLDKSELYICGKGYKEWIPLKSILTIKFSFDKSMKIDKTKYSNLYIHTKDRLLTYKHADFWDYDSYSECYIFPRSKFKEFIYIPAAQIESFSFQVSNWK